MKEHSGFARNFDDKQESHMFAKIIGSVIRYPLSAYTALTSSRSDLGSVSRTCLSCPTYYRITESQNSRGWKGPLWVI